MASWGPGALLWFPREKHGLKLQLSRANQGDFYACLWADVGIGDAEDAALPTAEMLLFLQESDAALKPGPCREAEEHSGQEKKRWAFQVSETQPGLLCHGGKSELTRCTALIYQYAALMVGVWRSDLDKAT